MSTSETDSSAHAYALERIAAGDGSAVADCMSLYSRLVWSLSRRFTRTTADAEDATQEIFLSLWTHAKAFDRTKGSEAGFVATIARRRLIDRRRKLNVELDIDPSVDVSDAPDGVDAGTAWQVLIDAEAATALLRQLRAEWRRVLELSVLDGLTQAEISAQLNMPLGTVKCYMRRGLLQMRDMLTMAADGLAAVSLGREAAPPSSARRRQSGALTSARRCLLTPA